MEFQQLANERVKELQYSTVNKQSNYSTVQYSGEEILNNLPDLINEAYLPWYSKKIQLIGGKRFIEIANRARAGSDTPKVLFRWMLNHPELVR